MEDKSTELELFESVKAEIATLREDNSQMSATIEELSFQNELIQEVYNQGLLSLRVEDAGWQQYFGTHGTDGELSLTDLKKISEKAREYQQFVDLIKRAVELRTSYIWGKGIIIPGLPTKKKSGNTPAIKSFYDNPRNQKTLFSAEAHEALETTAASDGIVLILAHTGNKETRLIPLKEIAEIWVDADFGDEPIAFRREWMHWAGSTSTRKTKWYYVADYKGAKKKTIKSSSGEDVEVDKTYVAFAKRFNRTSGELLGLPDTAPALPSYSEFSKLYKAGTEVQLALATITAKATSNTKAGNKNTAVAIAGARGYGNTLGLLEGQDLQILNHAGRGYDFASIRPWAARVASNYGISVVDLLSDPGAAGNSYGASETLATPRHKTIEFRQKQWAEFISEIYSWAIGKTGVEVVFPSIDDPDPYRDMQDIRLGIDSGGLGETQIIELLNNHYKFVTPIEKLPDGFLMPNSIHSLARRDIDTDGQSNKTTQASPNQGTKTGAGRDGTGDDMRDDTIS